MLITPKTTQELTEKSNRKQGGAYDTLARVLKGIKKIVFGTGTIIEDRPGVKEAGGKITNFVNSNSVFEIYQKEPVKNSYNFIVFGKKATGELFNTNYIDLHVNAKSSEVSPGNGQIGFKLSKGGIPYRNAKIALYEAENYVDQGLLGAGARVEITGEETGGGVQLAYFRNSTDTFPTSYFILDADGIQMYGLPTTNPGVGGKLWNDAGTLKITNLT